MDKYYLLSYDTLAVLIYTVTFPDLHVGRLR